MSMTAVTARDGRPILWVPPAHLDEVQGLLFWVQQAVAGGSETRRRITENHPLLFALVYLPHHLRSAETNWETSLCQMHLDMAEEAQQWRYRWGPAEYRVGWVGPREIGKSTWMFLILPCWALCHGWRDNVLMLAAITPKARQHFRNLKREIEQNSLLREDYPEFCTPGDEKVDNALEYVASNGASMSAAGFDSNILGSKERNVRPNLIICDDIEPTGAKYTPGLKKKRLRMLMEQIFPMNLNAVVVLIGTVTRYGSIMHEIVQSATGGIRAQWIRDEHIDCRYYPAIVIDPETGREVSFWPQRWDDEYMDQNRHTDLFQLSMMNMPISQSKGFWRRDDYRYNWPWPIECQVLSIDPAMKSQERNDPTGVSVIGFDPGKMHSVVQWAEAVWLDPDGMRGLVEHLLLRNPLITHVIIETNQGGDYVLRQLTPVIPPHIKVMAPHESVPKIERIKELHDWYQLGWVWHVPGLHAAEEQMNTYPDVDHDDIVDSIAKGVRHFLQHRPLPVPR